jgi:hypothetical protein
MADTVVVKASNTSGNIEKRFPLSEERRAGDQPGILSRIERGEAGVVRVVSD